MLSAAVLISSSASSYVAPVVGPRMQNAVARANAPAMDETILEKALAGELEEEGAENVFMSELGWATYLDEKAGYVVAAMGLYFQLFVGTPLILSLLLFPFTVLDWMVQTAIAMAK